MAHERGTIPRPPASYAHEEKVVYPQRLRESGGTSLVTLLLAFMTGATVAFFILSMVPQTDGTETIRQAQHSIEVTEALNLLTVLDLDIYSDVIIRKKLTVSVLSQMNIAEAGPEFRPFHWKRIVSEAKKMRGHTALSAVGDQPPVPPPQQSNNIAPTTPDKVSDVEVVEDKNEVDRKVDTLEEVRPPLPPTEVIPTGGSTIESTSKQIPGAIGSLPGAVGSLPGAIESPPKKSIPGSIPGAAKSIPGAIPGAVVGSSTDPDPEPEIPKPKTLKVLPPPAPEARVTPPPRPGFAPNSLIPYIPKEESAICGSMARSKALKKEYLKTAGLEQLPVAGVQDIPICDGGVEERESVVSGSEMASLKVPINAPSGLRKFVKNDITKDKIAEFRRRGTAEQWYIDKELKFLYCVVPKAGCTTLKAWMLNNAELFKGGTVHNRQLYTGPRIQNVQFVPDDELLSIFNDGEYFKFTVVRSPYTRVLATYLERFENCEKQTRRTKQECDMWKRALIGKVSGLPSDNSTFTEILDVMKQNPLPSVDFRNSHWLPNVDVCSMNEIKYDWVGRLEDPSDLDLIYNVTGAGKMKDKRKSKGLRHSEGTSSKMARYYTETAKNLVSEIYGDTDILRLGYHPKEVVPEPDAAS